MQNTWLIYPYRLFVYPLLMALGYVVSFKNKKLRDYFSSRQGKYWQDYPVEKNAYWIHCSSGEVEYAKPWIEYLNEQGIHNIFVTYFSPSAKKILEKTKGIRFFCPAPFDNKKDLAQFIEFHQAKHLYVSRTDLWPEMIYQANQHGLKTHLFAATLGNKNKKLSSFIARYIFSSLYSWLTNIHCVSVEDRNNFARLGLDKAHISGDPRYIQVLKRLKESETPANFSTKKKIIFGSTWPEDEAVVLPCLKNIIQLGYQVILVPHEVDEKHLHSITSFLEQKQIRYTKYSSHRENFDSDCVLIDQVGILASLYPLADIAFIGGSFKGSVHSVMEALAAGCNVLVGPYHHNNREALIFKKLQHKGLSFVYEASDKEALIEAIKDSKIKRLPETKNEIIKQIQLRAKEALNGFQYIDYSL